jgi:hypothetical protein
LLLPTLVIFTGRREDPPFDVYLTLYLSFLTGRAFLGSKAWGGSEVWFRCTANARSATRWRGIGAAVDWSRPEVARSALRRKHGERRAEWLTLAGHLLSPAAQRLRLHRGTEPLLGWRIVAFGARRLRRW